jgi:hypothetical protein
MAELPQYTQLTLSHIYSPCLNTPGPVTRRQNVPHSVIFYWRLGENLAMSGDLEMDFSEFVLVKTAVSHSGGIFYGNFSP